MLDVQPVDPEASQSPALQAYRILERAMVPGALPAGSRLPSERDLSERLSVSRSTLRQVLGALADSGLIQASPQRGWYVTDGPISDPPNALVSFTESARIRGIRAGAKVLGNIRVGHSSRIAAGSVVLADVPPCKTVAGVPARIVGEAGCDQPSVTMDHLLRGSC